MPRSLSLHQAAGISPASDHSLTRMQHCRFIATVLAELLLFDLLALIGLRQIERLVKSTRVSSTRSSPGMTLQVCESVRDACVLYFKPVHCLQRAVATTRMLRRRGIGAVLVIGYLPAPIRSHAWVEVESVAVINKISHLAFYTQLDTW